MVKDSKRISLPKGDETRQARKDCSSDASSCISSLDQETSKFEQPGYYYPAGGYYAYYYPAAPGFGNSVVDWAGTNYVIGMDGQGIQGPVSVSDTFPLVYYMTELHPGYDPCCAMGIGVPQSVDGKYLAEQTSATSAMIPQPLASPLYYPTTVSYAPGFVHAYSWDGFSGYQFEGKGTKEPSNITTSTKSQTSNRTNLKSSTPEMKEVLPLLECRQSVASPPLKQVNKLSNLPDACFTASQMSSNGREKPARLPTSESTAQNYVNREKLRFQNEDNRLVHLDSLRGHNHDPGMKNAKLSWVLRTDQTGVPTAKDIDKTNNNFAVKRESYNLPDFPTNYEQALFFVIKSYSEDDVHKSIKYNVWSSTTSGNRKLDQAFLAAQQKTRETGRPCPVFLFFSVNVSGQFCGVAEMIGRVDFSRNMEFWQQDKWNGFFPVRWHIIKDVPNPQFRHIILENNENRPVTYSRDTQEVVLLQGSEMLNIFKSFSSKTSILDDFTFYEDRQKVMQARRTKRSIPLQLFMPRANQVAHVNKDKLKPVMYGLEALRLDPVIQK